LSPHPRIPDSPDAATVAALRVVRELQPALQRQDRAAVVPLVGKLINLRPAMGEQWAALAQVAAENGEIALAREAIAVDLESAAGDPRAAFRKVNLLASIGAWDEGYALLETIPENVPDAAAYACRRGTMAHVLGRAEEARHYLGEAIRLRPAWGSAWVWLAGLVDFARESELAERLITGERQMAGEPAGERGAYAYAVGKAHADRGEHAAAFAAYSRGAAAVRSQQPYSREQDRQLAADAVDGFTAQGIADIASEQEPASRTIFVMGLPRSGTTLVEQILASHSAVADGGEINRLPLLLRDIGGLTCADLRGYVERNGTGAARRLWRHWVDERFPGPGLVVDKSFSTTRLLGLAAALLPDAPLIWLTRDPLDCAWSCFRTPFHHGTAWSYDLEDIAFHFRLEDAVRARWQEILGERLLLVPYEALAREPDAWVRRILAHCGLDEEPQAFAPHETRRAVTTVSTMQVRRPINRDAIGAAGPYRPFLEPFVSAFSA
jgi:tetratricopeptide (TPR) repeat protein